MKRFTTLADVCAKSRRVLSARDEGEDPIAARRDKKGRGHRAPVTFKQATEAFRKAYRLPKIQAAYRRDSGIGPRTPMMESYGRWLAGAEDNIILLPKRA